MKILKAGQSVLSDLEKAIYSYNNLISNLNTTCETVVGNSNNDIISVRCVGTNPNDRSSENTVLYTATSLANNPTNSAPYSAGDFNGVGKGTDKNYITDYERMLLLGIKISENEDEYEDHYAYFLASRIAFESSQGVGFYIRYVSKNGEINNEFLWELSSNSIHYYQLKFGVRPVITMSASDLTKYLD